MMKGGHGQTNQLHDINWSARDANYCVCVRESEVLYTRTQSKSGKGNEEGNFITYANHPTSTLH